MARVGGIARLNVCSGGVAYSVRCCRHQPWINRFPTIFRAVMPSLCKNEDPNGATGRSLSNSGLRPCWWAVHSSSGRGRRLNICFSDAGGALALRSSRERRRNKILRRYTVDIDQVFTNHDAGDANTLFDMVDRNAVQVEAPPTAKVTAKRETARVAEQGSCLCDSRADHCHVFGLPKVATPRQKLWLKAFQFGLNAHRRRNG